MHPRAATWRPVSCELPDRLWSPAGPDDDPGATLTTTVAVDGLGVLRLDGLAVADGPARAPQRLVDRRAERALCGLYDPDGPWQTCRVGGRDYVLVGYPVSPTTPAAATVDVPASAWTDNGCDLDYDRLLCTVAVRGRCRLHLEARAVDARGVPVVYPDDLDDLRTLAGRGAHGFPLAEMFGRRYLLFAYPHGD